MNWPNFLLGIYYAVLPKSYWRSWRPSSTVDFARSAIVSGVMESMGFLYLLGHNYWHFLLFRTHQLQGVAGANEGTQLYFLVLVSIEYALHPRSLICIGLVVDGAVRASAAFLVGETVPSFPINMAALVQAWLRARRSKPLAPGLPDLFERLPGAAYDLRICSQEPKEGWRVTVTAVVEGEFYEIGRVETGAGPRPFVYLLRKLPAGAVVRGMYRYDPRPDMTGS